jgi:hypothetical protein
VPLGAGVAMAQGWFAECAASPGGLAVAAQ